MQRKKFRNTQWEKQKSHHTADALIEKLHSFSRFSRSLNFMQSKKSGPNDLLISCEVSSFIFGRINRKGMKKKGVKNFW